MINPNVRAKDRIYSELPEELKALMRKYILSEDEQFNFARHKKTVICKQKTSK